jgi:hypothetical protein
MFFAVFGRRELAHDMQWQIAWARKKPLSREGLSGSMSSSISGGL